MTKTEELMVAFPLMASLISDVHAEGVAEGAERMKAEIREAAFGVFDDVGTQFLEGVRVIYIGKPIPIMEKGAAFVPASVLAPTKEGMTEKETETQHKMVEQFTTGIDNLMIEAIKFRPKEMP